MLDFNRLSAQQISQCLTTQSEVTHDIPQQCSDSELQQAAVLIPFVVLNDEWHLVFIRRAAHDKDPHGGQVAFAGGKYEPDDRDLLATALREAEEEIGIRPHDVTILGRLNHHHSISRFKITPVVAQLPWPYLFVPDRQEVARVFTIPLQWLADPAHHRVEQRRLNGHDPFPVTYFKEYDGELLWGASARITLSLISMLTHD